MVHFREQILLCGFCDFYFVLEHSLPKWSVVESHNAWTVDQGADYLVVYFSSLV